MRCAALLLGFLCFGVFFVAGVWARPAQFPAKTSFEFQSLSAPAPAPVALGDTAYFGGTVWNPGAMRWEAIPGGTWTFDSGVGSNFDHAHPDVDETKDPLRHAFMEGWVGRDFNREQEVPYFRRIGTAQSSCVGTSNGLQGSYSMYAGVLADEVAGLCYLGTGYGNDWYTAVEREFTTDGVTSVYISFDYAHDLELDYDHAYVVVDVPGQPRETLFTFTGVGSGPFGITWYPSFPGTFTVAVVVRTDGGWSDEDGLYTSGCGAFAFDNVYITGSHGVYSTDFETDNGGWVFSPSPPSAGGEWSDIVPVAEVDTIGCWELQDTVLVFFDPLGEHPSTQFNMVISPWIDLQAAGREFNPVKFLEFDIAADLPIAEFNFLTVATRYAPATCAGPATVSAWDVHPSLRYFSTFTCDRVSWDISSLIPLGAEQVQVAIGVHSLCAFYGGSCTGNSNTTPWLDNIRLGTATTLLTGNEFNQPGDAFPVDGTTNLTSTARMDAQGVTGAGTRGDTLVVQATTWPLDSLEVEVVFAVHGGPGINAGNLNAWLSSHPVDHHAYGVNWYSARMDTAQVGSAIVNDGRFRSTYHESDPNFTGTDTDTDAEGHLVNKIFPDELFTPGTRLGLYYRARTPGTGGAWSVWPDTSGGNFREMEVLPSSLEPGGNHNDILYVNATRKDSLGTSSAASEIHAALRQLLPGGSANAESTEWDRFDLYNQHVSAVGMQGTLDQLLLYDTIIWNAGEHSPVGITHADALVLHSWLKSSSGAPVKNIYLSGTTYLADQMSSNGGDTGALLWDALGVFVWCDDISQSGCPGPSPWWDPSPCFVLEPLPGAPVADIPTRQGDHRAFTGMDAFTYLLPSLYPANSGESGAPVPDEQYVSDLGVKQYASIVNVSPRPGGNAAVEGTFRSVFDGHSVHMRQVAEECKVNTSNEGVWHRLQEVLTFFGYAVVSAPEPKETQAFALGQARPNPFAATTHMQFSLASAGAVTLEVYDIQGRLVRTLVDGALEEGPHRVAWDGRDDRGMRVSAGMYFYRLQAGVLQQSRKVMLIN